MIKLIRGLHNLKNDHKNYVATIGNFDGMHLGHQQLLNHLIKKSKELHLPSLVITFEPSAQEYFLAHQAPARLMTFREKLAVLSACGVNYVLCLRFDASLAKMPATVFVETLLVNRLNLRFLMIGDDFCFGANREGNLALLKAMSAQHGFVVEAMQAVFMDDERVGSSRIRVALRDSNFELAKKLLGRHFAFSGHVVYGNQQARQLGFPTANMALHRQVTPLHGVFVVRAYGLERPLLGVANIGYRPTLSSEKKFLLEVHLLDFNQVIYGKFLRVEILKKLRDEKKFDSVDALKKQIQEDVALAKKFLEPV